jgi:LmbE family N-acetylglucosaminyl deacetylase
LAEHVASIKHLVTVFSSSMWVEPLWNGPQERLAVTAVRVAEDVAFCSAHGFRYHGLGLPDSSIRHGMSGNLRNGSGHEPRLRKSAQAGIGKVIAEEGIEFLVGPLGLGHSDHFVCADAVRRLAAATGLPALYYEDLPYAYEMSLRALALKAWRKSRKLRPLVCRTQVPVRAKVGAALTYDSQRKDGILKTIEAHSHRLGSGGEPPPAENDTEKVIERVWTETPQEMLVGLFDTSLEVEPARSGLVSLAVGSR